MKMAKIKFSDSVQEAEAIVELSTRVRVFCLPDGIYEVPAGAITLLDTLGFKYEVLETEGFDYLVETLRNSVTA